MPRTVILSIDSTTDMPNPSKSPFVGFKFKVTNDATGGAKDSEVVVETACTFQNVAAGSYTAEVWAVAADGSALGTPVRKTFVVDDGVTPPPPPPPSGTFRQPGGLSVTVI